jgi:hypothetical protein
MKLALIGRIAGALTLTLGLAACVDMTQDLTVTSETTAKATMTMVMGADIYSMMKAANTADTKAEDKFCAKEGEKLTENADGGATCESTTEGTFDALAFDEGGSKPTFTSAGPGLVRVALTTKDLMGDVGKGDAQDEQTKAMMKQMFEGHFLTLRFGGVEVVDTNMTLSDDHKTAEVKIAFTDLLNGTAKLPDELFAVVKTN